MCKDKVLKNTGGRIIKWDKACANKMGEWGHAGGEKSMPCMKSLSMCFQVF